MASSTVEGPQTQDELLELERFREVVVGTELEPGRLVVQAVCRSEHENGYAASGADDVGGDLVAGRTGDVAVQHRDVIGVDPQQLEGKVTVGRDVGGDGLQPQPVTDGLRPCRGSSSTIKTRMPSMLGRAAYRAAYRKRHTRRQRGPALTDVMTSRQPAVRTSPGHGWGLLSGGWSAGRRRHGGGGRAPPEGHALVLRDVRNAQGCPRR